MPDPSIETVEVPHPLPDPLAEMIAERFRVLGEPTRVKLLDRLRDGEASVQELQGELDASQQNVSKHLSLLLKAGMVSRTKRGTHSFYSIADEGVFTLCEQVCGGLRREAGVIDSLFSKATTTKESA